MLEDDGLRITDYGLAEKQTASLIRHPSSVICHLSSLIRHLSSVICHPSSVIRHLARELLTCINVFPSVVQATSRH